MKERRGRQTQRSASISDKGGGRPHCNANTDVGSQLVEEGRQYLEAGEVTEVAGMVVQVLRCRFRWWVGGSGAGIARMKSKQL